MLTKKIPTLVEPKTAHDKLYAAIRAFKNRMVDINDQINVNRAQHAQAKRGYDQCVLNGDQAGIKEHGTTMEKLDREYGELSNMTLLLGNSGPAGDQAVQGHAQAVYAQVSGQMGEIANQWKAATAALEAATVAYLAAVHKAGALHKQAERLRSQLAGLRGELGNGLIPVLPMPGTMGKVDTRKGTGPVYFDNNQVTQTFTKGQKNG